MQAPEPTLTGAERGSRAERLGAALREPHRATAIGVAAGLLVVYSRTLLPGVSFQDWAEAQFLPATLGVHHSTGYPLYTLTGWLASLAPVGSLAYRANLLSAVSVALAMGVLVLILGHLRVRPLPAGIAAVTTGLIGTVWIESAVAEMNGLHLLLVALAIHRLLVWGERFRPRDLWILGLLCGLSLSNHRLAIVVVPFIAVGALWLGRGHARALATGVAGGLVLFAVGLVPYAFIPIRATFGPDAIYGQLTTWDGFWYLVSGEQHSSGFSFFSLDSIRKFVASWPALVDLFLVRANPAVLILVIAGELVLAWRRPAVMLVVLGLAGATLFVYVNYAGAREQYLLAAWLVVGILVGVALEAGFAVARTIGDRMARGAGTSSRPWAVAAVAVAALLLPISLAAANWAFADQSGNRDGDDFVASVMDRLPPNAVIITYWDALTTLGYATCVGGIRPDVTAVSNDPTVRTTCRWPTGSWVEIAAERPLYALTPSQGLLEQLERDFDLRQVAVLTVPSDRRFEASLPLYELIPKS